MIKIHAATTPAAYTGGLETDTFCGLTKVFHTLMPSAYSAGMVVRHTRRRRRYTVATRISRYITCKNCLNNKRYRSMQALKLLNREAL